MRILVGMSGGIDSTFAAHRLMSLGHEVAGAVIDMHEYSDISAARSAADALGVSLYIISCRKRFEERVVSNFASEYRSGRTPNPCIVCNSEVKFECLVDFALENRFDAIATGHYASVMCDGGRYYLCDSKDTRKDQTYMLWRLSQRVLSHLVLPLSDLTKDEVRVEVRRLGLVSLDRPDSQEICFIPDNDHGAFIKERVGELPAGDFVDKDGRVLGRHNGIVNYTVGQRKGLGISLGARAFISEIDPITNRITLSTEVGQSSAFSVRDVVFSGIQPTSFPAEYRLSVKHRYQAQRTPATVTFYENGVAEVRLDTPAKSVTPGQSAVFYLDEALAAGGFIDSQNLDDRG